MTRKPSACRKRPTPPMLTLTPLRTSRCRPCRARKEQARRATSENTEAAAQGETWVRKKERGDQPRRRALQADGRRSSGAARPVSCAAKTHVVCHRQTGTTAWSQHSRHTTSGSPESSPGPARPLLKKIPLSDSRRALLGLPRTFFLPKFGRLLSCSLLASSAPTLWSLSPMWPGSITQRETRVSRKMSGQWSALLLESNFVCSFEWESRPDFGLTAPSRTALCLLSDSSPMT